MSPPPSPPAPPWSSPPPPRAAAAGAGARIDRRAVIAGAGGAAAAAALGLGGSETLAAAVPDASASPRVTAPAASPGPRRRYAIVGTGARGSGMWGVELLKGHGDLVDLVGLCDSNGKRALAAKRRVGADCPTFTSFDELCERARPEVVTIATVDSAHCDYIVRALDRGIDVITEKPMITDELQCARVLEAERRSGRKVTVAFNYRYAPKHRRIKELLQSGVIGRVLSVDFAWYLDTSHGADYFRRWHRLRSKGGTLFVHKATHHFDLLNWWLDADPIEVSAAGALRHYGKNGPFRASHCRACPHAKRCPYHVDIRQDPVKAALYVACESADGYRRDGCVFSEDVDIYDTMSALVRYSGGATVNYSLNAFLPYEGHAVAINGDKGRIDVRDHERQPWPVERKMEVFVTRSFGKRERIDVPDIEGGHSGGDARLQEVMFRGTHEGQAEVPAYLRLPDARAGAMSCLTGIAARKSVELGRPVKIAELMRG